MELSGEVLTHLARSPERVQALLSEQLNAASRLPLVPGRQPGDAHPVVRLKAEWGGAQYRLQAEFHQQARAVHVTAVFTGERGRAFLEV